MGEQPSSPEIFSDIYMPDGVCMVQVYRLDEDGLVTESWAVSHPFTDVCDRMTDLFGAPLGGNVATAAAAARIYSAIKGEEVAGEAQAVEY